MKRFLLQVTSALLIIVLCGSLMPVQAAAPDGEVITPFRWSYLLEITADINIGSGNTVVVTAGAKVMPGYRVSVTAELQELRGGLWKPVTSWTRESVKESVLFEETYGINPGGIYRNVVTATVIGIGEKGSVASRVVYP